ncbi:hypothetical protein [Hyphococcus sp.]|uniref:hypothetical protein n=1 Tax=Hyphococcus sp. TaxID=2038636 RepID=UPI0035C73B3F
MPAKGIDPDLSDPNLFDIAALATFLKTDKARKAFQAALKKGSSPTLSLTAAISASLVSAAAKESAFDPLAGLVAVDDLSAFGEDCLPGLNYAAGDEHDHDALSGSEDHKAHLGHSSYLADPFASRFASAFAREHESHDGATGGHSGQHGIRDSHGANHASAQGSHAGGHGGHQAHQSHSLGATEHHSDGGDHGAGHAHEDDGGRHVAHGGGHDSVAHHASGHEGGGHGASHASHHSNVTAGVADAHGDHGEAASVEGASDDLEEGIAALTEASHGGEEHHAAAETPDEPADDGAPVEAETTEHHHHHEATLAEMDAPPLEDLAATMPAPVI